MLINNIGAEEKRTWIWIKQRLAYQESSFSKLALYHGVKRQIFSRVKHFPIPKYERIIAEAIEQKPWDLWPDRYDANGNPARISSRYPAHRHVPNLNGNKPKVNEKNKRENKDMEHKK